MPERLAGMAAGQVEGHPIQALADPAPDLEQSQPQRPQLQVGDLALSEPATDSIQEPVSRTVQKEPELIGPEAMTAQAIGEAVILEVLDTEFGAIPAPGVPGVEVLRRILPRGDHKAQVEPLLERFRFVDYPPLSLPGVGLISPLVE